VSLIISGVAVAQVGDTPLRIPAPPPPASVSPPIAAPAWPEGWLPLSPISQLFARTLAPSGPNDKGSTWTDASDAGSAPAEPNPLELLKLEMARRAVEASRASGTLWVVFPGAALRPATPDVEAKKLELRNAAPADPPRPDPSAAVGPLVPVQIPGAPGLTPGEKAKRNQTVGSSSSESGKEGSQP